MTTNTTMPKEKVPTLPAEEAFTILEAPLIRLVRGKPVHKFSEASLTPYPTAIGGQWHSRIIRVWSRRPHIGKRIALYYHAKVRVSIVIIILASHRPWECDNEVSFLVLTPNSVHTSPEVELCGYSIPHPSEAKMNIRIQTYGSLLFVRHIWVLLMLEAGEMTAELLFGQLGLLSMTCWKKASTTWWTYATLWQKSLHRPEMSWRRNNKIDQVSMGGVSLRTT